MAIFNPDVPDSQAPNWTGASKPITTPEGNKAGLYLGQASAYGSQAIAEGIKGAGELLSTGIKAADEYIKEGIIKPQERAGIETVRDNFTEALQAKQVELNLRALNPRTPSNPDQNNGGGDGDSLGGSTAQDANVPTPITSGLEKANTLESALSAKKISETHYIGELNSLAKSLRAQYPGYVDYIDNEMSKVTGMNPANAYFKSIRDDIHNTATVLEAGKNKLDAIVYREDNLKLEGYPAVLQNYRNGKDPDGTQILAFINKGAQAENKYKALQIENNTRKISEEAQKSDATAVLSDKAHSDAAAIMDGMLIGGGFAPSVRMSDFLDGVKEGRIIPTEEEGLMMQRNMAIAHDQLKARLKQYAYTPPGPNQPTLAKKINDVKEMDNIIESSTSGLAAMTAAFGGKTDWSLAFITANQLRAERDGDSAKIHALPGFGADVRKYKVLKEDGVPASYLDNLTSETLRKGYDEKLQALDLSQRLELRAQTAEKDTGNPTTIVTQIDTAAATKKFDLKTPGGQGAKFIADKFKEVQDILKPDLPDETKANIVKGYFSSGNLALIDKVPAGDYYDSATKRWVPGKFSAFNQLTTPAFASEIKRLSERYPELKPMYQNSVETWFGASLAKNELQLLKDLQEAPGIKMSYDSDMHQWKVGLPTNMSPAAVEMIRRAGIRGPQAQIQQSVSRLNLALNNVAAMHDELGGDTNGYLVQLMKSNGVNPEGSDAAGKMMKALISARKTPEEAKKVGDTVAAAPAKAANYVFKDLAVDALKASANAGNAVRNAIGRRAKDLGYELTHPVFGGDQYHGETP